MDNEPIIVSVALGDNTHHVGRLWHHYRKGREAASFEYVDEWLNHPSAFALEPSLPIVRGVFHTEANQVMFGCFDDTAPDRWGRVLMRRSQRLNNTDNATRRTLNERDYIFGVNDDVRQGAIRFSATGEPPYLDDASARSIPPSVDLPKLLSATERFIDDHETDDDLKLLLVPGSSLGGARPKASVRLKDGKLAIAKFPRKDDEANVVVWEAVTLTLAQKAGITVPHFSLETIASKPVLIIERFDRHNGQRVPFISAMTMLNARDGEQRSYLEMAYALIQQGANPDSDLSALFRRLIFTILVSNTDDHLRNHGFVHEPHYGWRLSPAYDINPTPVELKPRVLSTNIDFDDSTASIDLALSVASEFRLSLKDAKATCKAVGQVVSKWLNEAKRFGLSSKEMDRMASAFEHDDLTLALAP